MVVLLITTIDCGLCRNGVQRIAELLEKIGATEHSELVTREHTLKVNR